MDVIDSVSSWNGTMLTSVNAVRCRVTIQVNTYYHNVQLVCKLAVPLHRNCLVICESYKFDAHLLNIVIYLIMHRWHIQSVAMICYR